MRILPASGSEWFGLLLVPFKVFVPAGPLMVVIERQAWGYRPYFDAIIMPFVVEGYIVTFCVLVLGAIIQRNFGWRKAYLSTCAFIAGVFVLGCLLYV